MTTSETIIHVRFAPDGSVVEIGERPEALSPQDWFACLANDPGNDYRALAGGRGVFRMPRAGLDALKAAPAGQ